MSRVIPSRSRGESFASWPLSYQRQFTQSEALSFSAGRAYKPGHAAFTAKIFSTPAKIRCRCTANHSRDHKLTSRPHAWRRTSSIFDSDTRKEIEAARRPIHSVTIHAKSSPLLWESINRTTAFSRRWRPIAREIVNSPHSCKQPASDPQHNEEILGHPARVPARVPASIPAT